MAVATVFRVIGICVFLKSQVLPWIDPLEPYKSTILDAWGWCTGTTQRDGMGREEGGGFRMGNTCIPVVDSF